jgi:hypothetical protein
MRVREPIFEHAGAASFAALCADSGDVAVPRAFGRAGIVAPTKAPITSMSSPRSRKARVTPI